MSTFLYTSHTYSEPFAEKTNIYIKRGQTLCTHWVLQKKKNRWKPIDTEKVGKPRNKIAVPKKNQKPDNAEKLRGVERCWKF